MVRKQTTGKNRNRLFDRIFKMLTSKSSYLRKKAKNRPLSFSGMRLFVVCTVLAVIVLAGCQQKNARTIDMYNDSEDKTGTVKLTEKEDGVQAKVKVEGLSPGFHGIHVHEYANCSGTDFKNAGSHFNPTGDKHGLMNSKGAHLGDMPNIKADTDGKLKGEVMVNDATLLDGRKSLLQGKGTSIVITEDPDDGMTQPGGDSGKRMMCGTIENESDEGKKSPSDPTKSSE